MVFVGYRTRFHEASKAISKPREAQPYMNYLAQIGLFKPTIKLVKLA
jgi:hypothetical protein